MQRTTISIVAAALDMKAASAKYSESVGDGAELTAVSAGAIAALVGVPIDGISALSIGKTVGKGH